MRGGYNSLLAGLSKVGLNVDNLLGKIRDPQSLAGYLELHIEQSDRLTSAGVDIGIVTSIVGICSYQLSFIGRADHAGTAAMQTRLDAGQGASAFTLAARQLVLDDFPNCMVNVGAMEFEPGAFNIVPARAVATLEFRAPDIETLDTLESTLLALAQEQANRFKLGLETKFMGKHSPAPMHQKVQSAFKRAAETLGLSTMQLPSGAGHDAQSLASLCPTGMIFVPSVGGASHSPREFTHWKDCINGANTLLQAATEIPQCI
jgi:N-carbamoyl-L-amino-acid hydrolase